MLDSKIQSLKDHFGITLPEDWQAVTPAWILSQDGVGQVTLDYLRLLLAARGLTLKGDRTPEYWQAHLKDARISHTLSNEELLKELGEDGGDRGVVNPFTIIIDTAEQFPFTFQGFRTDGAADKSRPLIIPTEFRALGRFPFSLGDYAPDCGIGRCHVERKSMQDAHGTFLGWARKGEDVGRRDRFEQELERLSEIEAGLVVVECSFADLVRLAPEYGYRSAAANAKTLFRSVLAWQQDYAVAWQFCDGRRLAEQFVFRWLSRWHEKDQEARKEEEKRIEKLRHDQSKERVAAQLAAI
jgi:hypothetical protein